MPSEVIRCTDCGAVFKAVPSWLVGAKVKFSCTNCPKRPSRGARFEPPPAATPIMEAEPKESLYDAVVEVLDDDADLEFSADEMDDSDIKDDKDL